LLLVRLDRLQGSALLMVIVRSKVTMRAMTALRGAGYKALASRQTPAQCRR
jgi:hypothetical protein